MSYVVWLLATAIALCAGEEILTTGCQFKDSMAICSNLNFGKIPTKISVLKIMNPESPLILEKDFFKNAGLESINVLHIENAAISKIDKHAFRNLSDLMNIRIMKSNVPDIHPDTFVDCTNLRTLDLAGSLLHKFEYIKSESLEELDISNCSIRTISNINFDNLSELVYLNLAHNFITEIELSTFANVINLEELNLSHNYITDIPSNLFETNTQLDTLDLSYNPLKKFQMSVVSDMEKLVLKGCRLSEFNKNSAKNLDLLAYLDLGDNQIKYLQYGLDSLSALTELEYIDLSNNSISNMEYGVFQHNTKLQKIILDNNDIGVLPSFVAANSTFATTIFSCNNCQLESLSGFSHMPALETVLLAHNRLEIIDQVFSNLGNLIKLDLSNNAIETINKRAFAGNSALQHLILSGNPLTSIDANLFESNRVLTRLELNHCALKTLWAGTHRLLSVKYLDVANNQLQTISQKDLNVTPSIEVLDVKGNPLACDSSFCNFFQWINDRGVVQPPQAKKTHDVLLRDAGDFETTDRIFEWYDIVNSTCGGIDACLQDEDDDDDYDDEDEDSSEEYPEDKDTNEVDSDVEPNDTFGMFTEFKISESNSRVVGRYSYIWPALVFIFTALLVLLIVANVLLLVLRKRGNLQLPRDGLPQIKIIPWSHGTKMKKHSGSVYQPLSEEKSEPRTPMINRYQLLPNTPVSVHKTTA